MNTSEKGRAFLVAHEGFVSRAYLDPVGVLTIGTGMTNRSNVFRRMWGRKLRMGDTITPERNDQILSRMLDDEYEPPVENAFEGLKQHEFDACVSAVYNLGGGAVNWRWGKALKTGDVKKAADILGSNYNTAGGRKLPGLVRRRKEEALLLREGIYTGIHAPEGVARSEQSGPKLTPDPVVKEAQEILTSKGFNPGAIDGWMGKKTKAAVLEYQKAHPHLENDGILGPATLAQLRRDASMVKNAVSEAVSKKGAGTVFGAISGVLAGVPWDWVVAGAVVVAVAYVAWRYRDVIQRRFNTLVGREVA